MKNILCSVVLLAAIIVFCPHTTTKAQETTLPPDTVQVTLSVEHNRITVNPNFCYSKIGGYVQFVTRETLTFSVIINNFDNFIGKPDTNIVIIYVTSKDPALIKIDSPQEGDDIKDYSVGASVSTGKPPLPPLAPPRIIILRQD